MSVKPYVKDEAKNEGSRTILECVVGSTLHGLAVQDGLEDLDLMAVVVEPVELIMSLDLRKNNTWVYRTKPEGERSQAGDVDYVAYGLFKYVSLALKSNPSKVLPLFAPLSSIVYCDEYGVSLREMKSFFVSKELYEPFRAFMKQQTYSMDPKCSNNCRPELVERYGFDTKKAGHAIRLGLQGYELLNDGQLTLPMWDNQRNLIREVRMGKYTLQQVQDMIKGIANDLDVAYKNSPLPEHPDRVSVQKWTQETYFNVWQNKFS